MELRKEFEKGESLTVTSVPSRLIERGRQVFGALSVLSLVQMAVPWAAFSEELHLGSGETAHTVDQNFAGTINLTVNGETKTVGAGSQLTGAEYATFLNAIGGQAQTLTIGQGGVATGGYVNLTPQLAQTITGLVVPTNVSLLHNVGELQTLNLTGNLTNSGNYFAFSTNNAITNGIINASNLYNNQNALLTSVLPSAGLPGGITGAISNLSLTLNIVNNLFNAGAITSAGNLNINAGAIYNQLPAGVTGASPIMQAVNNLNLNATLGNITNSGTMAAVMGNVNLASVNNMVINNVNGSIQALMGNINVRDAAFDAAKNLDILGGNFVSQQLNLHSGKGDVKVDIIGASGLINVDACNLRIVSQDTVNLGTLNLTGDPGVYSQYGDINIGGSIITGGGAMGPLALVASGSIRTTQAGLTINTDGPTGGNIFISAGGLVDQTSASSATILDRDNFRRLGGNIDFSTFALAAPLSANGTAGAGGNITMITLGGEVNAGTIAVPTAITATGTAGGAGGNILILADAQPQNVNNYASIVLGGGVDSSATGGGSGGSITIATAKPNLNTPGNTSNPVAFVAGDQLTSVITKGSVRNMALEIVGGVTSSGTAGGAIDIQAGTQVTITGPVVASGNGGAGGNIALSSNSNVAFTTGLPGGQRNGVGGVIASQGLNGNGGQISVTNSGTGGIVVTNPGDLSAGAFVAGNGGSINLSAANGDLRFVNGGVLDAGGQGNGGTVSLTGARVIGAAGSAVVLLASGATGNGGAASITQTRDGEALTIGNGAGQFVAQVNGAVSGGSVTASSAGNLTVDPAGLIINGGLNGSNLSFSTTGSNPLANLLVTDDLSVNGKGAGNGGSIILQSVAARDFLVGGATVNGFSGGTLSARGGATGNGGAVTVTSSRGMVVTAGINARGGSTSGSGGTISLTASGSTNGTTGLEIAPSLLDVTPVNGNGGTLTLVSTSAPMQVNGGTFELDAAGTGNGGTFSATAHSLLGNFNVTANAATQGNGGAATITTTSNVFNLSVGAGVDPVGTITANGIGSPANAGRVSLTSAADLTVTMAGITADPGTDGSGSVFSFTAGTAAGSGGSGNLLVVGAINVGGAGIAGNGGQVNLTSNSNLPFIFNLGLGGLNGLTGASISANGGTTGSAGTITINNTGSGGITIAPANFSLVPIDGAGGTLSLTAANGPLNLGGGTYDLSAVSAATANNGGTFTATARDIILGGPIGIMANGAVAGGAGGSITITETGDTNAAFSIIAGTLTLAANAGAGTGGGGGGITVSVPGSLVVDANALGVASAVTGAGGRISLTAGTAVRGSIQVINNLTVDGINAGGGSILLSATGNLSMIGNLSAQGTGTGPGGSITLNANGLAPFVVGAGITFNGVSGTINASSVAGAGGRLSITNPSGITIGNLTSINLGAGNGAGGTLTLSAANGVIAIDATAQNFIDLNGTAGSGGQFNLSASSFNITGGTVQLRGQGTGGGGGVFSITSTAANADLSVQSMGQFTILGGGVAIAQQTVQNVLPIPAGTTVLTLPAVTGLAAGQTITVTQGALTETVQIVSVDSGLNQITVTPLTNTFPAMMAQPVVVVVNTSTGTVSLSSGRNLTVVSADVQVAPTGNGPGANYSYNAGTSGASGNLLVTGPINAAAIGGAVPDQAGGSVTLTSTGNTRIVGNILTTGTGNAASGSVTLTSNSNSIFTVDPTNLTASNGVQGIINTSSAGNVGGSVAITNSGVGGINIRNADTDLLMTTGIGAGASFTANAGLGVFSVEQGGTINVNGKGGTLSAGGTVSINAGSIAPIFGHLKILAQGGTGAGGSVTLNATGASSFIELHSNAVGAIDINTSAGASGNGGTINVTAGTRILVAPDALVNNTGGNGVGGPITLTATGQAGGCCGSVLFTGPVSYVGQTTSVIINVNTVTPFTIGTPGTSNNGIVWDANTLVAVDMNGAGGGSGGTFSVNQTGVGGVVISNGAIITARAGAGNTPFRGGSVSISAGSGGLTLGNGTIDVGVPSTAQPPVVPPLMPPINQPLVPGGESPQANGGTITISSNRLTINAGATGAFNLLAVGGVSGQGGNVSVTLTDTNTALNVGSLVGQFNIDARGGAVGGRLTLSSGQNLNVTAANAQFGNFGAPGNFDGGRVSLTASGNVFWNGNLNAAGQGVGDGGQVTIRQGGFGTFFINAGNFGSGINGTLSVATGLIAGNGGLIDLSTTGFGTIQINGGFTFNANGRVTTGPMGMVDGIIGGTGATSGTMNGGTVNINTNSINLLTAGTTTMTANGAGSGNGGTINFNHRQLGIQAGGVGNNFAFTATGGSTTSSGSTAGNGGSITLTSNSNLLIQAQGAFFNASPLGATGNGATYALTSGSFGQVAVTGTLSANGVAGAGMFGDGGTIRITQPGSALFGIGGGLVGVGVSGNITADGAFINGGKGGTIVLALGTSTVQLGGAAGMISAQGGGVGSSGVNSDGGTITFTANQVNPSVAGAFTIRANGGPSSNGGTINFTSNLSPISAGVSPNTILFAAGGGSVGSNINANGGTLNLAAPSLNIVPLGIGIGPAGNRGNGGTMVLTANLGALIVSGSLSANAGTQAGNGGRIDLISTGGGPFQYNTGAAPLFNGISGNASAAAGLVQGNGGTILVRNQPSGITVGAAATFNVSNASLLGQTAGTVTLDAGNGALVINAPTISTTPFIGNGGTINLSAGTSITGPAGAALVLSSDGGLGGNGGTVSVRTTQGSSNVGNLTIGNLPGNISIRARGGASPSATNGGTIDISSTGFQLTVDPAAALLGTVAANGDAGTLRLTAAANTASPTGNLQVTSGLNLNGIGRGNGGTLVIRAKGVNNFVLNGNTTNGVNGIISVNGGANGGNAGSIDIEQLSVNSGGGIVFNSVTPLTASATRGNAGSIKVAALGLLPIQFTGAVSLDVSSQFQDRNGGTIDIQAARFLFGGGNVALTSNGTGTGNGGVVTVRSTGVSGSASDIVVGTLANQFNISVLGGSVGLAGGNGGTVNLSVASPSNSLTINPAGLNFGPIGGVGNGGTLTASAGLNLFVNGTLSANSAALGGNGGSITLTSGTNFPSFGIFAGAATNGINGLLTANALGQTGNGGTLNVTSTTPGGITLGAVQTIQASAGSFDGQGGTISLTATANGTINLGTSAVPISVDGTGTKQGGTITLNSFILTANAGANQTLQSRGGTLGGRGGTISVTVTSPGSPLTVGAGAGQLALAINSNGLGSSGTISLVTSAALNLNNNGLFLLGAAGNNVGATLNATSGANGGFGSLTTIGSIDVGNGTGGLLNLRTQQGGTTILQTGLGAVYSGRAIQLVTPGSLGSALAPIQTAASVDPSGGLQVQSTGAGSSAFINQTGALALGTSTAGFQLNVTANNDINVVGAISGASLSQINLTTSATLPGNGAINIRADVAGQTFGGLSFATANINANGSGAITNTAGVVRVGTLNLTSTSGNIGTRASRVITTATSISANTSGNVFLFAAASPTTPGGFAPTVNVGTSSASAGTFDYLACGSINFIGNLNTPTLFLGTFSGDINASGSVLNTVGSIGITSANNATISKGAGPLTLLRSDVTNSLSVTTQGVLTINGPVTGNNLTFASNGAGGGIVINGNITGTNPGPVVNSQVTFNSFAGNSLTRTAGNIVANTVSFNMGSGGVGTNLSRIVTDVNFINNSGFGATNNVFINELNGVTLGTFGFVSAGGTFDLRVADGQTTFQSINAGGAINIGKLLDAGNLTQLAGGFTSNLGGGITLTTFGNSPIILNGIVSAGGTGAINISGVGAGASVTFGTLTVNNATLSVTSGSGITQNAFTTASTNNGNLSISATGGNAILNGTLRTNSSGTINVVSVPGSIVMNSASTGFTGPNSITITAVGGSLTVNPNSIISAGANGNLTLQANNGSVTLTNSTVSTSGAGALAVNSVGGAGGVILGTLSSGAGNINVLTAPGNSSITGSGFLSSITSSSGNISLNEVGGGGGGINLTSDVSTTTAGSVTLLSLGTGGIAVRSVRTGSSGVNTLSITAVGGSVTVNPNSMITAGTNGNLSIQANNGSVTLTNATVSTSGTGTLTVNSVGGVGGVLLGTLSSGAGAISVLTTPANSSITGSGFFSSVTSSSGGITLNAVGGGTSGVNLTGDVSTTTTGNITILATGTGGINVRNVRTGFTGPNNNISLTAPGAGGGITQAAFTSLSTGTGGTVTLTSEALSNLQNIMAGGAVSVTSTNGGITQAASTNVSGSSVTYTANNGALGNITLNGMLRSNAGVVNITAGNNLAVNSSVTSTGGNLSLTANIGTLVSNTSGFLNASGGNLLVQTNNGAAGNITLGATATVNADSTGVRTLTVQSARSATVGSLFNFDPTGATSVSATTGVLQLNAFVSVQGDLSIINTGGAAAGDAVIISPFVSLFALAPSAPQGNITIALTNGAGIVNVAGVPPSGGTVSQTTSGGGQIFFGPNQFQNTGFTTLNAKGANITFFNNKAAGVISSGIQTNSNFIFADPPVGGSPMAVPSVVPVSAPSSLPSAMALPMMTQPASTPAPSGSASGSNSATQLQMPAQVQGIVDIFRPFFVSPTPATATPVDTAPMQNVPVTTSTPDVITQVRDAGGAMVQSAVANVNNVLTGFVSKKSGAIGGASSYMRPSHQAVVNQLDDSTFELKHGEVIVSANRRSTVTSGEHTVDAAPGSIVHVTREGEVLKVRNLCDSVGKAVHVLVAGKSMPVNVGEEVVIGVSDGAVNSAIKGDNIGRRKVSRFVVDGRHSIVKSELSVIALIQKSNLLTSMYTKGSAADRNVMERIMKMAAALFQVTGKRGAYSAYDPSKVDAPVPLSSAAGDQTVKVAQSR